MENGTEGAKGSDGIETGVMIKKTAKKLFPPMTRRRRVAAKYARAVGLLARVAPDIHYAEWVERTEPFIWTKPQELAFKPRISMVVPVYNPPAKYLLSMVYSVVNQTYDNWQLVLVNASSKEKAQQLTKDCARIDTRVKVVDIERNEGIAGNTNRGIDQADGDYVGLLDHDDILTPQALFEVAFALQGPEKERPRMIYSDEDKLMENGDYRFDPYFKPDWSPHILRHVNYLNHLMVIERTLIRKIGGYRQKLDGAQDYDLFLRLVDEKPIVRHIPKILYHWRAGYNSTARDFSSKKNVLDAGVQALQDHLKRNKQRGAVQPVKKQPGFYKIAYEPDYDKKTAVIILPTANMPQYQLLVDQIVDSLKRCKLETDLFVWDDLGYEPAPGNIPKKASIKTYGNSQPNKIIQEALEQSNASTVMLINAGVVPKSKHWLERLVGLVTQVESIGVAAPILTQSASKTVFDAGYMDQDGRLTGVFQGVPLGMNTYAGNTIWGRNVEYLSGRVCAMRRSIFEEYFSKPTAYKEGNMLASQAFKSLLRDGFEAVVMPSIRFDYRGDMRPERRASRFINPNLAITRNELGFPRTINVPPKEPE